MMENDFYFNVGFTIYGILMRFIMGLDDSYILLPSGNG